MFAAVCTMSMRYASARDILLIASTQRANHAYAPCAIAKARKNSERTRTRRKLVRARVVAFFVLYVFILIVTTSHNPFRENGDRHLLAMVQYFRVDFILKSMNIVQSAKNTAFSTPCLSTSMLSVTENAHFVKFRVILDATSRHLGG